MDETQKKIIKMWDTAKALVLAELFTPPNEEREVYELVAKEHILSEEDIQKMGEEFEGTEHIRR